MIRLAPLLHYHTPWVQGVCAADPAGTITIQRLVDGAGTAQIDAPSGVLWGTVSEQGSALPPESVFWIGYSVTPLTPSLNGVADVALLLNRRGRYPCSLVGHREPVLDVYRRLVWGPPRGVRPHQPLLVACELPDVDEIPVRVARTDEYTQVYDASVAMFKEEVGFSPEQPNPSGYRARVRSLLTGGHTLVLSDGNTLIFKADLGVISSRAVQVQGVWVHPAYRGQGIASRAMVSVTRHALAYAPTVSLYVNSFNTSALGAYARAGYRQIGEFATVMY